MSSVSLRDLFSFALNHYQRVRAQYEANQNTTPGVVSTEPVVYPKSGSGSSTPIKVRVDSFIDRDNQLQWSVAIQNIPIEGSNHLWGYHFMFPHDVAQVPRLIAYVGRVPFYLEYKGGKEFTFGNGSYTSHSFNSRYSDKPQTTSRGLAPSALFFWLLLYMYKHPVPPFPAQVTK